MYRVPQYWNIDGRIFAFDMFYDGVTYRIFHNMSGDTVNIPEAWRTNAVLNNNIPSQGSPRPGANNFLVGTAGATATSMPAYSSIIFASSVNHQASNIAVPNRTERSSTELVRPVGTMFHPRKN